VIIRVALAQSEGFIEMMKPGAAFGILILHWTYSDFIYDLLFHYLSALLLYHHGLSYTV